MSHTRTRLSRRGRTLVLEDYPEANIKWCQSQDIQFMVRLLYMSPYPCPDAAWAFSNLAYPETR